MGMLTTVLFVCAIDFGWINDLVGIFKVVVFVVVVAGCFTVNGFRIAVPRAD